MTDALIPDPSCPTPTFEWRGFMLDSARTCWSVPVVHELLDVLARYRFNRLHWHLTDDAGWRFAVPGYERLTSVSARLPRQEFLNYDNVDPGKRAEMLERAAGLDTAGWYTDDDIAGIVAHARRVGIRIVPEVDLPGHMAAVIAAYPQLGDPALREADPSTWRSPNDLLWPTDEALEFIGAALDRVIELFGPDVIHIGADECNHAQWAADPELAATMHRLGAADHQQLQGWFTTFARDRLAQHGCRAGAWDEASETPLHGDELIFAWREGKGIPAARNSGHDWIYAHADELYLNRLEGPVELEPAAMFGQITVRTIWDAVLPLEPRLRGLQAAVWAEFIADRESLHYQMFPRLLAVAERAWCGDRLSDYGDFIERLTHEVKWLSANGFGHHPLGDLPADAPLVTGP